MINSVTFF
jgi:hypothetical protein